MVVRTRRELIVRAWRLDADEEESTVFEVWVPAEDEARRHQLIDEVRRLYATARIRAYADGVASFLAPELLIVAEYGRVVEQRRIEMRTPPHLFEDVA